MIIFRPINEESACLKGLQFIRHTSSGHPHPNPSPLGEGL